MTPRVTAPLRNMVAHSWSHTGAGDVSGFVEAGEQLQWQLVVHVHVGKQNILSIFSIMSKCPLCIIHIWLKCDFYEKWTTNNNHNNRLDKIIYGPHKWMTSRCDACILQSPPLLLWLSRS